MDESAPKTYLKRYPSPKSLATVTSCTCGDLEINWDVYVLIFRCRTIVNHHTLPTKKISTDLVAFLFVYDSKSTVEYCRRWSKTISVAKIVGDGHQLHSWWLRDKLRCICSDFSMYNDSKSSYLANKKDLNRFGCVSSTVRPEIYHKSL